MIDLETLSDEELEDLRVSVLREQQEREVLRDAPNQANKLAKEYAEAIGRVEGDEWSQPTASFDSYPSGSIVTHNGLSWISTAPANVWEPGVSGWRVYGQVSDWIQPSGAHDAYTTGERVMYQNDEWESTIDGNVWEPSEGDSLWIKLSADEEQVEEEPEIPEFIQPTGSHDSYNLGDQVLFEGSAYESLIDGNTWSPGAYPAGWKLLW